MKSKGGYVYIMSNKLRTVLYVGVTSNLENIVTEYKEKMFDGFSKKYNCIYLIYYEIHDTIEIALEREKRIKKWKRAWKENLIKGFNRQLKDLWDEITGFD